LSLRNIYARERKSSGIVAMGHGELLQSDTEQAENLLQLLYFPIFASSAFI